MYKNVTIEVAECLVAAYYTQLWHSALLQTLELRLSGFPFCRLHDTTFHVKGDYMRPAAPIKATMATRAPGDPGSPPPLAPFTMAGVAEAEAEAKGAEEPALVD